MEFFTGKELAMIYRPDNWAFDTWSKSSQTERIEAAIRLNIAIAERLDKKPAVDEQTDDSSLPTILSEG